MKTMDELKKCPFTRKEKMAVNNLKIDNGNGAYITKRDTDTILSYIKFLQSEVERLSAEPENKPLTLEQLRQMDCKSVWICYEQILFGYNNSASCSRYKFNFDDYGKTWLAYARKPEQEEK